MKQKQLVDALRTFGFMNSEPKRGRMKGQATFALFLADYIEKLTIPADQEYDFWHIDNHIPMIIVGAIRAFEKSDEIWIVEFRKKYEKETDKTFSDPTLVNSGNNINAVLEIEMIKELIDKVMGPTGNYLQYHIDSLLSAERHVVALKFAQFQDQVYHIGGLSKIIAECPQSSMSGKFGKTSLRSLTTGGRLIFTFARENDDYEESISFVCDPEDLIGIGGGLQSCYAEFSIALDMIEEVITKWPTDKSNYKFNKNVAIC